MPPPPALPSGSDPQNGHLRGLILQKEKELHDINEYRIHTLENLVGDKEKDITEHKQRLQKMKDDFCFNLKLLEERDAELERYDASFSSLKAVVRERDQELCELKIATAELQHNVKQERDRAAAASNTGPGWHTPRCSMPGSSKTPLGPATPARTPSPCAAKRRAPRYCAPSEGI